MNVSTIIGRSNFNNRWKWRFLRGHVFMLPFSLDASIGPLQILSRSGNVLVDLHGSRCAIHRHYHFDGATKAPDFEKVLPAAALHDALLQLKDKYPEHITWKMANQAFRSEMQVQRFKLWPLYYAGVELWRWLR